MRVVLGHPQVDGALGDDGVEELLTDAVAVPRVEQVDEVQLALARGVVVAGGAGAGEADDLAVDEGGDVRVGSPWPTQCVHSSAMRRGRQLLERGRADEVVVVLVPAGRVHAPQHLGVDVADGTNDYFGAHGMRLEPGLRQREIEPRSVVKRRDRSR